MYVQDRVEEDFEEVCDFVVERDATFYICGSADMAREVAKRVGAGLKRIRTWDDGRLRMWQEKAKRANRWQEDVWGYDVTLLVAGGFSVSRHHADKGASRIN